MPAFPQRIRVPSYRHLVAVALCCAVGAVGLAAVAPAQSTVAGAGFLADQQAPDGSWASTEVRREQATTTAVLALQTVAGGAAARAAAATWLATSALDTDDEARRILVLRGEGVDVAARIAALRGAVAADGGWGLNSSFRADPLDTALALTALGAEGAAADDVVLPALQKLVSQQADDGGWSCVGARIEAPSEIFCSSHALLALAAHDERFVLDAQIDAAVAYLKLQMTAAGAFGPADDAQIVRSALAATALASVPALGQEVSLLIGWLESRQLPDGSWQNDPYVTALAVRALGLLADVPYCGDAAINQPGEACDLLDLGGATCESIGLGAGQLACSASCTFDTSACTDPPVCGDDVRNQEFEVCDGLDLASESCESLGFASGDLACAADCTSFDVGACLADAACGDGVINQPSESCDLSDLGGLTCDLLGLGGGLLQCTADCNFDTAQCDASGFVLDNKGREFIVGFLRNYDTRALAAVHLTSDEETTARIEYPAVGPSFVRDVTVTPGQVTVVNLPIAAYNGWSVGQVLGNAVRVSAPDEVVAYLVNRRTASTDAGMALPIDALGTSYIVSTYRRSAIVSRDRGQFLVVAPFDGTEVTITPSAFLTVSGGTAPPDVPFTVSLNRGEGFRSEATFSNTDPTGTLVEATRPVAVINGNVCTNVPSRTVACDHIFEVAHPVRSWGRSALVTNLPRRPAGSIYRIVASEDDTEIRIDGVVQTVLDRGEVYETTVFPESVVIEGDHPIFVTQYMTGDGYPGAAGGDPAMTNVIPPEQFLDSYTFSTVGGSQFSSNFLTITVETDSAGSVLLDGAPVAASSFAPIGGSDYSSAVLPIGQGTHTTSSAAPHGITVEGYNSFDSYIYPGGAQLEFINEFCGDGVVNLAGEECDGTDYAGATCSDFGFASGTLACTTDCRVDTTDCEGFSSEDEDGDGYPTDEDCDDTDPDVNPGAEEIPGNGVDDDCNPATPDEVPAGALRCDLVSAAVSYAVDQTVVLQSEVENLDPLATFTGLQVNVSVSGSGLDVYTASRELPPLPPGGLLQQADSFAATVDAGPYVATFGVLSGGDTLVTCSAPFTVDASGGDGLVGELEMVPGTVDLGEESDAVFSVSNLGNEDLPGLVVRVQLIDPDSGEVVAEVSETLDLAAGESFDAVRAFATADLESNVDYLAVLSALAAGSPDPRTLDSDGLSVVNAPPDCSTAGVEPTWLWPPNHKMRRITVGGVEDPDGDPVTLVVTAVLQDEDTGEPGSGSTCPDAEAIGLDDGVEVRAERSGRLDGRVYHLVFRAEDGRGGSCEGEVTVCVPHDRSDPTCGDQGLLHDAAVCQ